MLYIDAWGDGVDRLIYYLVERFSFSMFIFTFYTMYEEKEFMGTAKTYYLNILSPFSPLQDCVLPEWRKQNWNKPSSEWGTIKKYN